MDIRTLTFTDVVDSTSLVERLGDSAAASLWAAHDRVARDLLLRCGGREIDRADGFLLLFDDVIAAANFALAYHRALVDLDLRARVAIHEGTVVLRHNDAQDIARGAKPLEVDGLAKPFCARLMSLATGGRTLLSPSARGSLKAGIDGGRVVGHGHYRLQGIEQPVEVFELCDSALRVAVAPPADTAKAYRVVARGDLWTPARDIAHNLPASRDEFVGRDSELRALAALLERGARLVTVLGPGGTGKTRLATRYGHAWLGEWPGGVYFCDLSEARSLDGVFFAVAIALEVALGKDDSAVKLGHAIGGRGRCLVILDNFEQVARHAVRTVGAWLARAADATFVVTSRELLRLPGETSFAIEPLALESDALDLFVARARAHRPGFAIDAANRPAIAEVVRMLDGLPLAIELAAARISVLSPAQLVERLRHRFKLLGGAQGAPARQATLKAAIDWSWNLLEPWEQSAFSQCSVFEGGFTMAAAEEVIDLAASANAPPVLDAIQALVEKSLLRILTRPEGKRFDIDEPYFGMYVSIQEYSRERLAVAGQGFATADRRHGAYYADLGTDAAIETLSRHGGVRKRRRLALEIDNLAAACRRATTRGDGAIALCAYRAAWGALEMQGPFGVAEEMAALVASIAGMDVRSRAITFSTRGAIAWRLGRLDRADGYLREALALARDSGDDGLLASVLGTLGSVTMLRGRLDEARVFQEDSLRRHREMGDRRSEGTVLGNLASIAFQQGRMDEARRQYEEALAIHAEVGNAVVEGSVFSNFAGLHHAQGRHDEARACCERALAIHREVGDKNSTGIVLGNLGVLLRSQGRLAEARESLQESLRLHRECGDRMFEGGALSNLVGVYSDQERIAEAMAHCDAALSIAREVGNPRYIGVNLSSMADLMTRQGRAEAALVLLEEGEALLRASGDKPDLANLLCQRSRTELVAGNSGGAREILTEAEAMAEDMATGWDSETGRLLISLREAIEAADRLRP